MIKGRYDLYSINRFYMVLIGKIVVYYKCINLFLIYLFNRIFNTMIDIIKIYNSYILYRIRKKIFNLYFKLY